MTSHINRFISFLIFFAAACTAAAQENTDTVLSLVGKNNTELKTLKKQTEADKYGYRAESALDDPEIGFDYLWGSPADIGRRKDFSVTQTLDLAVLFGAKGKLRASRSELADMRYNVERQRILLEDKKLCINLTYCNILEKELSRRMEAAEKADSSCSEAFRKGEISARESNEARMALLSIRGAYNRNAVEKASYLTDLKRLNGGEEIQFGACGFADAAILPDDFDLWYDGQAEKSPALAYVRQNVKVKEQEMKTVRMSNAPKITAGYMSELVTGENFRGLTVGLSVPLWSVRSSTRQADASYDAAILQQQDAVNQYYSEMSRRYARALGLQDIAGDYRQSLEVARDSEEMIRLRHSAGDISLIETLTEMKLVYDTADEYYAAERDYRLALAELLAWEL